MELTRELRKEARSYDIADWEEMSRDELAAAVEAARSKRLYVNIGLGADAEVHIYVRAKVTWTDHGTLVVEGRRINGYNSPCDVRTEYPLMGRRPSERVVSVETR